MNLSAIVCATDFALGTVTGASTRSRNAWRSDRKLQFRYVNEVPSTRSVSYPIRWPVCQAESSDQLLPTDQFAVLERSRQRLVRPLYTVPSWGWIAIRLS